MVSVYKVGFKNSVAQLPIHAVWRVLFFSLYVYTKNTIILCVQQNAGKRRVFDKSSAVHQI